MLSENQINKINQILYKRVFKYKGGFLVSSDASLDIDYKVRLLGYKKMISVGEWTDYLMVEVEFISYNDKISEHMFPLFTENTLPLFFKSTLRYEIQDFLSIFDEDIKVDIVKFKMLEDIKKQKQISESTMSNIAIRTVVRDIIKKVKQNKSGTFYLPEEDDIDEYIFTNLPFSFSVELTLKKDGKIDRFMVNGYHVEEEEVVEIIVVYNPKKIVSQLYDLVGELNELVAHELEHGYQEYRGEFMDKGDEPEESLAYYTQDHEIPAQYRGFKRLSKLTKKPIEQVAMEWFKNNQDIHGMTKDEIGIVLNKILEYGNR